MYTEKRIYQYKGLLNVKKSCILKEDILPKDDTLPWLFLVMDKKGKRRFTFFYVIEQPTESFYEKPFNILMSFIMDGMGEIIELYQTYDVWRGEEFIGNVKITKLL
ncbi:hypothetical protein FACS1894169_15790 [Bacteroidia bacterium]|nr:hypothetical protein FACS1894169_15790 [Bacteroidia bacterium]